MRRNGRCARPEVSRGARLPLPTVRPWPAASPNSSSTAATPRRSPPSGRPSSDYRVLGREEDGAVEIGPEAGLRRPAPDAGLRPGRPTRRRASCGCTSTSTPPTATRTPSSSGCSALGATPADVGQTGDEGWHVLADPEGNEFCLLKRHGSTRSETPRDPDRREVPAARARPRSGSVAGRRLRPRRQRRGGQPVRRVVASLEEPDTCRRVEGFRDADAGAAHVRHAGVRRTSSTRAPDLVAAQPQIIYVDAPDVSGLGTDGRDPAARLEPAQPRSAPAARTA